MSILDTEKIKPRVVLLTDKPLTPTLGLHMGCDPELFIERKGRIIGSERVIPVEGLTYGMGHNTLMGGKVIRDGIQVELNPAPSWNVATVAGNVHLLIKRLHAMLSEGERLNFNPVVHVEQAEFDALSQQSQQLGCMPSRNIHTPGATVDATAVKLMRSAGGHIHLAVAEGDPARSAEWQPMSHERIPVCVPVMDILVGNTCVMLDKGEEQRERRKHYGRAGEYRLPKHGLEYRTLSNFWLRSWPLMSFVFGLARMSVAVVQAKLEQELFSLVDVKSVVEAINQNDPFLAYENYARIKPFLSAHVPYADKWSVYAFPLAKDNMSLFDHFLTKNIEEWFPEDPIEYWLKTFNNPHTTGWPQWLERTVKTDLLSLLAAEQQTEQHSQHI